MASRLCHFIQVNQGLHGFPLEIVILKLAPVRQPMICVKPVVQQQPRRVRHADILPALAPFLDLLANRRHARRSGDLRFQQGQLRFAFLRPPRHGYFTFTFTVLVVSLPRMSITLTMTLYSPFSAYVCVVSSSSFGSLRVRYVCHWLWNVSPLCSQSTAQ